MSLWMTRIALISGVLLAGLSSLTGFAQANELLKGKYLVAALQQGNNVIYLRHSATDSSTIDKNRTDLTQWTQQRNLSNQGREQARIIGRVIKALNIPIADVVSSPYCRCIETAQLAVGRTRTSADLAFAFAVPKPQAKRYGAALLKMLQKQPAAGQNNLVVAHSSNLKEANGMWPKPEGVTMIFRPSADGSIALIGRVEPQEWVSLAESVGVSIDLSPAAASPDMRPTWCGGQQLDAMHQR